MTEQEWLMNQEMLFHMNSANSWYRYGSKSLAYDEIQICIGMVYAAVAMHMLTPIDGLTIMETLRRSEMCAGYLA